MDNLKLGTLFLFVGALTFVSTLFAFDAHAYAYQIPFGGFVLAGLEIGLGVALRRTIPAARFFALGLCLLMVIGAFLVPILTFLAANVLAGLSKVFSLGEFDVSSGWARFFMLATCLYAIVMGVFGYRGLKYLRSNEGRLDFARPDWDRTAEFPRESVGIILASAVLALVVTAATTWFDFEIRASSLPAFLRTDAMNTSEGRAEARRNERVTSGATFTADSRHIVFGPSEKQDKFLVLDLASGKLRRVAADVPVRGYIGQSGIAADGSSIVLGNNWLSLVTGKSRRVDALPPNRHLGFSGATQFLVYDEAAQKLELIDLERGAAIYSHDVPVAGRGDPHGNDRGWSMYSQLWTPDRGHYLWLTRDGVLNDLDVASGSIAKLACADCTYAGFHHMAPGGDAVLFVGNTTVNEAGQTATRGMMYRLARRDFQAVDYRGRPIAIGDGGGFAIFQQNNTHQVIYHDLSSSPQRQWALDVPTGAQLSAVIGDRWFTLHVRDEVRGKTMFGAFDFPEAGGKVRFALPRRVIDYAERHIASPDGRYLLYVAGAKIEVIDLQALANGKPANRTMDLLEDDELESGEPESAEQSIVATWREFTAPPAVPEPAPEPARDAVPVVDEIPSQTSTPAVEPDPRPIEERASAPPKSNAILKCVDGSGSVTFTQVACPPGTKLQ
jgi:hypothetical protein